MSLFILKIKKYIKKFICRLLFLDFWYFDNSLVLIFFLLAKIDKYIKYEYKDYPSPYIKVSIIFQSSTNISESSKLLIFTFVVAFVEPEDRNLRLETLIYSLS